MSGDPAPPSDDDEGATSSDSAEEEDTLQSQAVFKGPQFLHRMLRFSEDDDEE